MNTPNNYPEYAAVQKHIDAARIGRVPAIANTIASFLVDTWGFIQSPPTPSPVIIERRSESRRDAARLVKRLSHR